MYHNSDDFRNIASNADFLASLVATLYPTHDLSAKELTSSSPIEIKPFAEAICGTSNGTKTSDEHKSYKSFLSVHPARKLVMDFLRDLIYDGLINSSNSKNFTSSSPTPVIDLVLASLPDSSNLQNFKRNQEFVTDIFKTIIDYLQTLDLFNDQQHSSTSSYGNLSISSIVQNYFNLIDKLVDKMWDGNYR